MNENQVHQRLSRISTQWTRVIEAHGDHSELAAPARRELLLRYKRAAYRYLLAAVGNADVADDLFQEFALRLARGDFRQADQQKGRFRDYLRTALINLIRDQRKGLPRYLPFDEQLGPGDPRDNDKQQRQFLESWRLELLACAKEQLGEIERKGGQPYFTALQLKTENPRLRSSELADRLNAETCPSRPYTDASARKVLQRARTKLAELLIRETSLSLSTGSLDETEEELAALKLLSYCRDVLQRMRGAGSDQL